MMNLCRGVGQYPTPFLFFYLYFLIKININMNDIQFLKLKKAIESKGENSLNSVFTSFAKEGGFSPSVVSNAYYSIKDTEYWKNLGNITYNSPSTASPVKVEHIGKKVKITIEL